MSRRMLKANMEPIWSECKTKEIKIAPITRHTSVNVLYNLACKRLIDVPSEFEQVVFKLP